MRTKLMIFLTLLLLIPAAARIGPISLENMVQRADVIAVVDVTKVDEPQENVQLARFESVRVLKGSLQDAHQLYRGHGGVCARPSYQAGRYLLFLRKQDGQLVAAYHAYSVFEIHDNKLNWFGAKVSNRRQLSSLDKAEADIRALISPPE